MYETLTLEQALSQKRLKKFAEELGMINAESHDLTECSVYINDQVSKKSKYSVGRMVKEFFGNYDEYDLPEIEKFEIQDFDKAFLYPLILGENTRHEDGTFPIYGAVFKSKDGDLFTLHIDLDVDKYAPQYYFNNKFIGYIKWGENLENYSVPKKFLNMMQGGMFTTCLVNKIELLISLDRDKRQDYFIPFYD